MSNIVDIWIEGDEIWISDIRTKQHWIIGKVPEDMTEETIGDLVHAPMQDISCMEGIASLGAKKK